MMALFNKLMCVFLSKRGLYSSLAICRVLVPGPYMATKIHRCSSSLYKIAQDPARRLLRASGLDYEKLGCFASVGLQKLWNIHNKRLQGKSFVFIVLVSPEGKRKTKYNVKIKAA